MYFVIACSSLAACSSQAFDTEIASLHRCVGSDGGFRVEVLATLFSRVGGRLTCFLCVREVRYVQEERYVWEEYLHVRSGGGFNCDVNACA